MSPQYRFPTTAELARIEREARRLRGRALADAARFVARSLLRLASRLVARDHGARAAH